MTPTTSTWRFAIWMSYNLNMFHKHRFISAALTWQSFRSSAIKSALVSRCIGLPWLGRHRWRQWKDSPIPIHNDQWPAKAANPCFPTRSIKRIGNSILMIIRQTFLNGIQQEEISWHSDTFIPNNTLVFKRIHLKRMYKFKCWYLLVP